MTETFHQQQSTLAARLQEQSQRRMDEFRREVEVTALQARTTNIDDTAALAKMEAAMKAHRESCEAEFHQRAIEYRDDLLKDQAKGASQLQTTVELLRSENLGLITQRDNQDMVDSQEQRKASQAAYEKTTFRRNSMSSTQEKRDFGTPIIKRSQRTNE